MGFLAPSFLFLLSLASIPFIIHLIQRIRLKKVYYSSLFFLTETKRETFSWLQLKEILLLIFRILFIFFLFFSLARPYLRKKILPSQYEASRIIILDDSYSMGINNFNKAKIQTNKLIKTLKKGSEAAILTASLNLKTGLTTDLGILESVVDTLRVSNTGNTLEAVFENANTLLLNATLPRKEIYIITDLQRRAIMPLLNKSRLEKTRLNISDIIIIDVGKTNMDNVGIQQISLTPNLPTQDFPSKPNVVLKNYSTKAVKRNLSFTVKYSESESLIQNIRTEVSINAGEIKTIPFDIEIRKPGIYRAEAVLSQDSLTTDDNRFFTVTVPEKTPILLMYEDPADIQYIEKALQLSYFEINTANIKTLRQQNLKRYKAIGLFAPGTLTYADWQRLSYYLLEGGGLFIVFDKEMKEEYWYRLLGLELSLTGTATTIKPPGFISIGRVNLNNPITEIFKDVDLSTAKFYSSWEVNTFSENNVLAYFSSGKPFLVEENGKKVILALSSFNNQKTDFMFKATFLPLIHRIFTYLSFPMLTREYLIGDTIIAQPVTSGAVKIMTPGGEFMQTPVIEHGKSVVKFTDTGSPGIYKIGSEIFAVNVIAEEGELLRVSEREVSNQNIRVLTDVSGTTTDLSRLSLTFAILFFLLELILLII